MAVTVDIGETILIVVVIFDEVGWHVWIAVVEQRLPVVVAIHSTALEMALYPIKKLILVVELSYGRGRLL